MTDPFLRRQRLPAGVAASLACIIAMPIAFVTYMALVIVVMFFVPYSPGDILGPQSTLFVLALILNLGLSVEFVYPRLRWRPATGETIQCRWCEREYTILEDGSCPVCAEPLIERCALRAAREWSRAGAEFVVWFVLWSLLLAIGLTDVRRIRTLFPWGAEQAGPTRACYELRDASFPIWSQTLCVAYPTFR